MSLPHRKPPTEQEKLLQDAVNLRIRLLSLEAAIKNPMENPDWTRLRRAVNELYVWTQEALYGVEDLRAERLEELLR